MTRSPTTPKHRDAGAASLELVILAPMVFAVLSLILVFGRYAETENTIDQAARDAARAATAQNSVDAADSIATSTAAEALQSAPSSCRDSADVELRRSPNAYEINPDADPTAVNWVAVDVVCTVDLTDLGPLPLQNVEISKTFTSPIDRYRGYAR